MHCWMACCMYLVLFLPSASQLCESCTVHFDPQLRNGSAVSTDAFPNHYLIRPSAVSFTSALSLDTELNDLHDTVLAPPTISRQYMRQGTLYDMLASLVTAVTWYQLLHMRAAKAPGTPRHGKKRTKKSTPEGVRTGATMPRSRLAGFSRHRLMLHAWCWPRSYVPKVRLPEDF